MKAWQKSKGEPGAELITTAIPKPDANEVLLRIRRVSVCGTDLHIYRWDRWAQGRIKPPLIFGHEFVGEVVEAGRLVRDRKAGDLLAVETHIACGHCHLCRRGEAHVCENVEILGLDRDGAFAEYITVPVRNTWPVPVGMSLEHAAALEPLGNAVHTVLAGEIAGCSIAVTGCGPLGLFAISVARACGAGPILATDVNDYRLKLALECGADMAINVRDGDWEEAATDLTHGRGLDVVAEMSGHPDAVVSGMRALRNGGRISLLGLPSQDIKLDLSGLVIFKGLTVQGIIGRRMFETWHRMTALLDSGRLDISRAITHVMALSDLQEAMNILESGQAGKIVLVPWGEDKYVKDLASGGREAVVISNR
jgi:threonine 3-dehydrogenase